MMFQSGAMLRRFAFPNAPVMPLSDAQKTCLRAFADAIEKGELTFQPTYCPCGARNDEMISQVDRLGLPLTNVICKECGLIRADPYFSADSLAPFYGRFYETLYHGPTGTLDQDFEENIKYSNNSVLPLLQAADRVPRQKRILMIGGRGAGMLQPFAQLGNDCTVVDFNDEAIAYARTRGISGIAGDYKHVKFEYKFDLILLDNVLEHFLNLAEEVRALRDLMTQDGGIFVAVPDAEFFDTSFNFADARKEFMLCHSYIFSQHSVADHMQALGFYMRAWDHSPFPQSLLALFERGEESRPNFSKKVYYRQKRAIVRAEIKYWLYKLALLPWVWRTVVPVLKRNENITRFYRRLRGTGE